MQMDAALQRAIPARVVGQIGELLANGSPRRTEIRGVLRDVRDQVGQPPPTRAAGRLEWFASALHDMSRRRPKLQDAAAAYWKLGAATLPARQLGEAVEAAHA